jgi:hypothetical protein
MPVTNDSMEDMMNMDTNDDNNSNVDPLQVCLIPA